MASRRTRDEVIIWVVLLMLQEWQVVMMINLQRMKDGANSNQTKLNEDLGNTSGYHSFDRLVVENLDVNAVTDAVQRAGEMYKTNNKDWLNNIKDTNCNQNDEAMARKVWLDNGGIVLPLYLSSSAVLSYLKGCPMLMRVQVEHLVNEIGKTEALEYVEYVIDLQKAYENSDDEDSDDYNGYDDIHPEGQDKSALNEATFLISQNIHVTESLADIFLSFNDSSNRSTDGLDDMLDASINQYLVMSSMAQEENVVRQKRSRQNPPIPCIPIHELQGKAATSFQHLNNIMSFTSMHTSDLKTQLQLELKQVGYAAHISLVEGLNKFVIERSRAMKQRLGTVTFPKGFAILSNQILHDESTVARVSSRSKRQTADPENVNLLFIKNSKYPCKLLTYQGGEIFFTHFDELSVTSQLWTFTKNYIRHYKTGFYMTSSPDGKILLDDKIKPITKFQFENGVIKISKTDCQISTQEHLNALALVAYCNGQYNTTGNWSYITLDESRGDISSIMCLFIIQKRDSCKALTYDSNKLDIKSLNDQNVINQLWYWDNQYIRHAVTHAYLTTDWTNPSVSMLELDNGFNQRWHYTNQTLEAKDLPTDTVLILNNFYIHVGSKCENSSADWNITIFYLNDDAPQTCEYSTTYFVIKHSDFPCRVMCTQKQQADPTFSTKLLVIGLTLLSGIPSCFLFLCCFEVKEAIIAGLIIGVILSSIATLVVNISSLIKIEYVSVYFNTITDSNLEDCLWYQADDGIKSVQHNHFLSVETVGSNNLKTVSLSKNSVQRWTFESKAIKQRGYTCGLSIVNQDDTKMLIDEVMYVECTDDITKYKRWNIVTLSESSSFVEQTSCFYFLRLKNNTEHTCSVLTTSEVANDTYLSIKHPSKNHLFNQLWYMRDNTYFNLYSETFNLSSTEIETYTEKVVFTNDGIMSEMTDRCERKLYFIKSSDNPCTLMTYRNNSGRETVVFQEFDEGNLMGQLWENHSGILRNEMSGFIVFWDNTTQFDDVLFNVNITSYADKILCPFFVQEQKPPCLFLTGNNKTENVFFGPLTSDLAESQIWFKLGNFLVHLQTGKSLSMINDLKFKLSAWTDKERSATDVIYTSDTILIQNDKYNTTVPWRRINSKEAFDDLSILKCSSYTRSYYFIKQRDNPCVVLTAGNVNETPLFDIFNEKNVQRQLWYEENSRIINMNTGLVLKMNSVTGKYVMASHMFYDQLQMLEVLNISNSMRTLGNRFRNCVMQTKPYNGSMKVVCMNGTSDDAVWEFIGYDALEDISKLMCLFYIRSRTRPCEFITGYNEGSLLKIRPLTGQLIQQQLFYTKGNYIVHQKTRLLLTYTNKSLSLQSEALFNSNQSWGFENGVFQINSNKTKFAITLSEIDGHAYLSTLDQNVSNFLWSKVPLDYDFATDESNNPYCSENINVDDMDVFFITTTRDTCVVLTADTLGEEPLFKVYDKDNEQNQMWFFHDNHVVNLATGLAIMVDFDDTTDEQGVVMWHKYTFSEAQRFSSENDRFTMKRMNDTCHLSSVSTDTGVTLNLECTSNHQSDLVIVKLDDKGEYIDKITCFFFIRSTIAPCELLTLIDNDFVIRPLSGELLYGQLWFWKDRRIVNVNSNKMMSLIDRKGHLHLHVESINASDTSILEYQWTYNNGLIKPFKNRGGVSLAIGFNTDSGYVGIQPIHVVKSKWHRQWELVSRDHGLKLAANNSFHCEKGEHMDLYLIRSEHHDCPLLNVVDANKVGLLKIDDSGQGIVDSAWWTLQKYHICNVQNQLCLSVNSSKSKIPDLEPRYAFKRNQRWTTNDELIKYVYGPNRLTYTGSNIELSSIDQGNSKHIWKWFSSTEIERDPKHLRCSRCYDQNEEKAAEIITWIPFISLFYNIGRSIVYDLKKCPKVALGALQEGLIDLAIDAIVIISAGTASAFAYGIKTATKLGFKAGVKAFGRAIKSMVKVAIWSTKKTIVHFVKTGFRRTLQQQLSKMKLGIKAAISELKKVPATMLASSKTTMRSLKRFVRGRLRSIKSLEMGTKSNLKHGMKGLDFKFGNTFKAMPGVIKNKLNKLKVKLSNRLKQFTDVLSKPAETAIKKADNKHISKYIRCKRTPAKCSLLTEKVKQIQKYQAGEITLPASSHVNMDAVRELVVHENRQSAAVGLHVHGKDALEYTNVAKISDDGIVNSENTKVGSQGSHTEPFLIKNLEPEIKKHCKSETPCDVYMYTKMSPCHVRGDNETPCLSVIIQKCKEWLEKLNTKCFISFDKIFKTSSTFSGWTDVLESYIRKGEFPTKANKLDISAVLADSENMKTISDIVNTKLNLHFYNDLLSDTTDSIQSKLDGMDVSIFFKGVDNDEYRLYMDLKITEDSYGDSFKTKFNSYKAVKTDNYNTHVNELEQTIKDKTELEKELKKIKDKKDESVQNAARLYSAMSKIVEKELAKKERKIKNAAKSMVKELNAVAGLSEATYALTIATDKAKDALTIYSYKSQAGHAGG